MPFMEQIICQFRILVIPDSNLSTPPENPALPNDFSIAEQFTSGSTSFREEIITVEYYHQHYSCVNCRLIFCNIADDDYIIINGLILPLYPVLCCFERDMMTI